VSVETVRYYERRKLLPEPPRSESGYRSYPPDALRRLRFIRRAKEVGFTLGEIRELLELRTETEGQCRDGEEAAARAITRIDAQIA
jgi:MerR family mercuric resistance operon transcriptional regulator